LPEMLQLLIVNMPPNSERKIPPPLPDTTLPLAIVKPEMLTVPESLAKERTAQRTDCGARAAIKLVVAGRCFEGS